jgi:hypothetical protein
LSAVCQRTERPNDCRSGRVVDLEHVRVDRLVPGITNHLRASGIARVPVEDLENVDRWRTAARRAGRILGWHVRTGVSAGWAWAASEDLQAPPGADHDAAVRFAALIYQSPAAGCSNPVGFVRNPRIQ